MATSTLDAVAVRLNLNNGYNYQTNSVLTLPVYLGNINPATYDPDKALAIADKIENCLTRSIVSVQEIKTSTIRNN